MCYDCKKTVVKPSMCVIATLAQCDLKKQLQKQHVTAIAKKSCKKQVKKCDCKKKVQKKAPTLTLSDCD
jgi:hypothetical protein